MSEFDHECTDEVVCPWCGCEFTDSWEFSDSYDELQCDECGKIFSMIREIEVSYSTRRSRCEPGKCELELNENYGDNPYIYSNKKYSDIDKNWTVWKCRICNREVDKISKFVGNEPRLELPTLLDFK